MPAFEFIAGNLICWFIPGYLFVTLLFSRRGEYTQLERVVLGVGASVFLTVLCSLTLAACHQLTRLNVLLGLLLFTVLFTYLILTRRPRPTTSRPTQCTLRKQDWIVLLHLLLMLAVVTIPRLYITWASPLIPLQPDSWTYMSDSLRLIAAGEIPETVPQWGLFTRFPSDKISFQLFTATLMLVSRLDFLDAMKVLTLVPVAVAAVAFWLLARQMFHLDVATLATILVFFDSQIGRGRFAQRLGLTFFRAEAFALMLSFIALFAFYRGMFNRNKKILLFVAFLLPIIATSHGVPALVIAILIGALYCGKWMVYFKVEWKEMLTLALIGVVSLTMTLVIFRITKVQPLYNESVVNTTSFESYGAIDPTYELFTRLTDEESQRMVRPKSASRFYTPPVELWRDLIQASFPQFIPNSIPSVVFFVGLVAVLMLPYIDKRLKVLLLAFLLFFLAIYLWGLLFSFLYSTYLPATHPISREFPYASLAIIFLGALLFQLLLEVGIRLLRRRRILRIAYYKIVYVTVVLATFLCFVVPSIQYFVKVAEKSDISTEGIRALRWLRENTQPRDVILSNIRTAGSIEIIADRISLTEGRGVYGRPDLLRHVFNLMDQAALFYQNPFFTDVLKEYGVKYVVVAPPRSLGGRQNLASKMNLKGFEIAPFLRQVASFGQIYIFEVISPVPSYHRDTAVGYGYLTEMKLQDAAESFVSAIRKFPDNGWAYVGLGDVYEKKGKPEAAVQMYVLAVRRIKEGSHVPYLRLASIYESRGDFELALSMYQEAVRFCPSAVTYIALGDAYRREDHLEQARIAYQNAQAISSDAVGASVKLYEVEGDLALAEGNIKQALANYRAALMLQYCAKSSVENSCMNTAEGTSLPWIKQNTSDITLPIFDFTEYFDSAHVSVCNTDPAKKTIFIVNSVPRATLFQHPTSSVACSIHVPSSSKLMFSLALSPEVWLPGQGDGVRFNVYIDDGAARKQVFSQYIDPKNIPTDRRWHDCEISLSPWAGQTITLTFATGPGPNGNSDYDWAGWGEPRIVQPIAYNFLAELPNADRCGADEEHLRQDTLTIDYEPRAILFQHPSSRVTYRVDVPERAGLHFGLGMDPAVWSPDKGDGVEYNVYMRYPDEPYKLYRVFHHYLDPKNSLKAAGNPDDRHWQDQVVDLSGYGGQTVDVIFEALPGPAGDANFDWGGWSMPVLVADDMALLNAEAWVAVRSGGDGP